MDLFSIILYVSLTWTFVVAIFSIARAVKTSNGGRFPLPPGPAPLPVVGNLFKLGNMPHKSLTELAKAYGPIMTLRIFNKTTVVISSAAMAKEVLQKQDLSFSSLRAMRDAIRAHQHDTGSIVWMPICTPWRNFRRICNSHIFTTQVLNNYSHVRRQKVQQLLDRVAECCAEGTGVHVGRMAFATSMNLLSTTIFSMDWIDLRSGTSQEMKEVVWAIMEEIGKENVVDYFPILMKLDPQGIRRRMDVLVGKLFDVFDDLIEKRLQSRKLQSGPSASNDILDILLDVATETTDLTVTDIPHIFADLFIAGTDTTSSTIEWAMAELLHHPTTLSKVRAELEQVVGKGNPVEEKCIPQLPYLQAVVKETLRLHTPSPFLIPREVETEVELCGFRIPKGTQVLVNAWGIARDPETWADPGSFNPERFLGSDVDVKGRSFELIPFGAGRRLCPGLPLALRMVHMMVGSLIHSFEWGLQNGAAGEDMDMEEKFGLTLQKAQPLVALPITKIMN